MSSERHQQSANVDVLPGKDKARPRSLVSAYEALASMPEDFYAEGRIDTPPQERPSDELWNFTEK